jgi:hypothetical protein
MQMRRPGSRNAAGAHQLKVAVPASSSQRSCSVHVELLTGKATQCKIDGLAFGGQVISLHDHAAGLVVDVDVGA